MFTEQLVNSPVRSKSPNFQALASKTHTQTQDLHFQICSAFLKKIGDKLLFRQAEIISDSSHLLNNFQLTYDSPKKDLFGLSTNYSEWSPDSQFSQDVEAKVIMRRNTSRRSQNQVQQALRQVKQQCSFPTFEFLSNLATQFLKTQTKIQGLETKQYIILKKQEAENKYHQQNIMLKNQLESESIKIRKLQEEISSWKTKNEKASKCVEEKAKSIMMSQKFIDINQKIYRQVKSFLQDKEIHINARLRKIQHIEESIMKKIEDFFQQENSDENIFDLQIGISSSRSLDKGKSCQKCCIMMKKLKNSILDYRDYLQNEAQEINNLYEKHKSILFGSNSKGITSNKSIG